MEVIIIRFRYRRTCALIVAIIIILPVIFCTVGLVGHMKNLDVRPIVRFSFVVIEVFMLMILALMTSRNALGRSRSFGLFITVVTIVLISFGLQLLLSMDSTLTGEKKVVEDGRPRLAVISYHRDIKVSYYRYFDSLYYGDIDRTEYYNRGVLDIFSEKNKDRKSVV